MHSHCITLFSAEFVASRVPSQDTRVGDETDHSGIRGYGCLDMILNNGFAQESLGSGVAVVTGKDNTLLIFSTNEPRLLLPVSKLGLMMISEKAKPHCIEWLIIFLPYQRDTCDLSLSSATVTVAFCLGRFAKVKIPTSIGILERKKSTSCLRITSAAFINSNPLSVKGTYQDTCPALR